MSRGWEREGLLLCLICIFICSLLTSITPHSCFISLNVPSVPLMDGLTTRVWCPWGDQCSQAGLRFLAHFLEAMNVLETSVISISPEFICRPKNIRNKPQWRTSRQQMVSCKYTEFSSFCLNAGFSEGYRNKHLSPANRHSPLLVQTELLSTVGNHSKARKWRVWEQHHPPPCCCCCCCSRCVWSGNGHFLKST